MRLDGLDLNLLVLFEALMREGSVTGAGQRLNLSQSATSAALGRLRDHFKDELFSVQGRRLHPSPLAYALDEPVRDILMRARANLIARPEFRAETSTRHFRLIVSDYSTFVLMDRVIRRAHDTAPGVTFELIAFDDQPDDPLRRGEVDFLIFPDRSLRDDHPRAHLFTDQFCCVVWDGNDKVGKRLSPQTYLSRGHVSARFGPSRRISFEERELRRHGVERRIEVHVPNFAAMVSMVVGTDRIATVHARIAHALARQFPIRILKCPFPVSGFRESLQWPEPLESDPAVRWMRDVIVDVAASLNDAPAI